MKGFTMQTKKIKQLVYKPTPNHTVIKKVESKRPKVTWVDIGYFVADQMIEHRAFLLMTFIIIENAALLVRMK